jgi:outer membrane protein insertion porin family
MPFFAIVLTATVDDIARVNIDGIRVNIDGIRVNIDGIRVNIRGARALSASALERRAQLEMASFPKEMSVTEATRRVVAVIVAEYRAGGFTLAQVVATDILPDGTWEITVAEGTIRSIIFEGNKRTRLATLRRLISLQTGQTYNDIQAKNDRVALARSGLFEDVIVTTRLPEESNKINIGEVDVIVRVKEANTGNVSLAMSYADQAGGLVGFVDIAEGNIAGTGQSASIQWQRVPRGRFDTQGIFRLEDTRQAFLGEYSLPVSTKTLFTVRAYNQNTVLLPQFTNVETLRNFERRRGTTLQVGQRVGQGQTLFISSRRDNVGYDPIPSFFSKPIPRLELANAEATVGTLGLAYQYTTPRFRHRLGIERSAKTFGSTRDFTQTQLDLRFYQPLAAENTKTKNTPILATRLLAGTTSGASRLPFSEQFFLGGSDLLRGYDFFSIRGANMALASIEGRVPLGPDVQGVLFYDYGGAWKSGEARKFQGGIGIGARFLSPFGPIRLDLAHGKRTQTYVSLGQSF